jgi:hypothetical protein
MKKYLLKIFGFTCDNNDDHKLIREQEALIIYLKERVKYAEDVLIYTKGSIEENMRLSNKAKEVLVSDTCGYFDFYSFPSDKLF